MTDNYQSYRSGFVAVVGRPNVGKSTLINAILQQKIAAVSEKPQTTRLNQLGILTENDTQIIFVDTPGIHDPVHALGQAMNTEAQAALDDADVILWVVDGTDRPHDEDRHIGELLRERANVIQALNKIDLIDSPEMLDKMRTKFQKMVPQAQQVMISALQGAGFDALKETITKALPIGMPFYPEEQVTDIYERDIAADLIREAALAHLHDEVPHAVAVRIDGYEEREEIGALVTATIFVERESQKGIVVGKGGSMIKQIGTMARKAIEEMSGRKVYLDLRVKVKKNWRSDPVFLQQMGYNPDKQ
jgi:GTP-binding protein Era